ncbi:MAG: PfkB family carbohydrate kinase [Proteobacteria bacterium]|nr:PfkB family carbohydrate kinase [Pseudomonadota bacterium]
MTSMLVVGSVAFDTLHIAQQVYPRVLGGSATYASLAGSMFTGVRLVAVVGRDFPRDAKHTLSERGVDLAGLEQRDGKTFHWEGRYSDDFGARTTLRTDLNVFADFRPEIPDSWRQTPFLMLGNIDPSLQLLVLDQVTAPRLVVADTMNYWIEGKPAELKRVLERVHVLVINDEEARQLARVPNLVRAGRALQKMGPSAVIVKKGEHGALLFDREEIFTAPALPLDQISDPTGAGDCFAGGLLGFLASRGDVSPALLRRGVVYGSVVASLCVEGIGPERLISASNTDLRRRFAHFRQLVAFGEG